MKRRILLFHTFVRIPDDGHIRRPKHVLANYNEHTLFTVLCHSGRVIETVTNTD